MHESPFNFHDHSILFLTLRLHINILYENFLLFFFFFFHHFGKRQANHPSKVANTIYQVFIRSTSPQKPSESNAQLHYLTCKSYTLRENVWETIFFKKCKSLWVWSLKRNEERKRVRWNKLRRKLGCKWHSNFCRVAKWQKIYIYIYIYI